MLADALQRVERPIPVDPRFAPRFAAGDAQATSAPRYYRSAFPAPRAADTLLPVYPDHDGELTVPLTMRHAQLRSHAGEVSLPGGAVEAGDADRAAAALREAHEEVGIEPGAVRLLGNLDDVWIPVSNFQVRPFVGSMRQRPELVPQAQEVAAVMELPVRRLLAPDAVADEEIDVGEYTLRAAVYRYGGERIWGATARTLAMFAHVASDAARGS